MKLTPVMLSMCVLGASLPGMALAKCDGGSETLFSCIAQKSGKRIEVCDTDKTISYSFGKPGKKPELALAVPRDEVTTWQWKGIGRYINYSVSIPNNNYVYRVFTSIDKMAPENKASSAGVDVEKDGRLLATINCVESTLRESLEGVNLKEED